MFQNRGIKPSKPLAFWGTKKPETNLRELLGKIKKPNRPRIISPFGQKPNIPLIKKPSLPCSKVHKEKDYLEYIETLYSNSSSYTDCDTGPREVLVDELAQFLPR